MVMYEFKISLIAMHVISTTLSALSAVPVKPHVYALFWE